MADKVVTLPMTGAKVTIKDPRDIRMGDRKKVYAQSVDKEGVMANLAMIDGVIAMAVKAWDLPLSLPSVDIGSLDAMEIPDYDFLVEQAKDIQDVIFGRKTQKNKENLTDPKVNTDAPTE